LIAGLTSRSLVWNDFEAERSESTLEYLKQYLDNAKVGMTAESYIRMEQELGEEPDFDKMPPSYEDFPLYVHTAFEIFNALPDTYSGGMSSIYSGKNYSSLDILFSLHLVESLARLEVFEVIQFLDGRAKDTAFKEAKKAADKAKRK